MTHMSCLCVQRQGGDLRKSLFSGLVVVCVTQVVRCSSCYTYTIEHISLSQHTNQGHSPYMTMQRDDSSSECKDESKLHNKGARQTAPLQLLRGCRFVTHWAGGGQVFNIYTGRIFFQDSDVQNKYQIICNNEYTSIHSQNDGKVMLLKSEQQHSNSNTT